MKDKSKKAVKRSMARQKRLQVPGGIYHVITRGINRSPIFKGRKDRQAFLERLCDSLDKTGSSCFAWVLMSNHIHLLIRTSNKPLSQLMRKLLTSYAVYYNHQHKRCGYLFQNRYKSILCQEDAYFLELIRYIHLNPVRARQVKNMEELREYPWTGHASLVGKTMNKWQSTQEVLQRFSERREDAIRKYEKFIEDGWEMGKREELTGGGIKRSFGGWEGVKELIKSGVEWRGDERLLGDEEFVDEVIEKAEEEMTRKEKLKQTGWDIEKVTKYVCENDSEVEKLVRLKKRNREISEKRSIIAYLCYNELEISGKQIAKYLKISPPSVSKAVERGEIVAGDKNIKLNI